MKPFEIHYDETTDVLTIEGIRYHADLFRAMAIDGVNIGEWFRIIERDDGVITIQRDTAIYDKAET